MRGPFDAFRRKRTFATLGEDTAPARSAKPATNPFAVPVASPGNPNAARRVDRSLEALTPATIAWPFGPTAAHVTALPREPVNGVAKRRLAPVASRTATTPLDASSPPITPWSGRAV